MEPQLVKLYGGKTRVRVCGLCWQGGKLLMVNHQGLTKGDFWAPPGGGLIFAEPAHQCLEREFAEETGLDVTTGGFLFACEFIRKPLHAIELFFEVKLQGGVLRKGNDPESPIISRVKFMSPEELAGLPAGSLHGVFRQIGSPEELKTLNGFLTI